ncbi:hypothetical protein PAAG_01552 [Paracoccidioides lutzii Pb01]|uniref:Uncharacterized protein n=1 Tax=Paracoccidioides lutzii (strain ATCC MYA-826 / Pb01) TaxID=502779 RepID=C1GSQ7_PARBA|nr:hypothetical protein PAAG_01552 [Paracoccidioides lutzii Pb01]EEH39090.2 hypothetical protein PAAG_01552 [Paracoccidioides lutzii Pb01]
MTNRSEGIAGRFRGSGVLGFCGCSPPERPYKTNLQKVPLTVITPNPSYSAVCGRYHWYLDRIRDLCSNVDAAAAGKPTVSTPNVEQFNTVIHSFSHSSGYSKPPVVEWSSQIEGLKAWIRYTIAEFRSLLS